jgi:hypothetical protein
MIRLRMLLSSPVALSMVATPATAACWEAEEYEAARMRDLQTMLMVSALKCGRSMPEMPAAYNKWVARERGQLLEGEKHLVSHFVREGDKLRYDKFTTALANRYSELSDDLRFCKRAKALLEADEKQNGVLSSVVAIINAKPNGVELMCPTKSPGSVIVVSPFAPIPVASTEPSAAPIAQPTVAAAPEAAPNIAQPEPAPVATAPVEQAAASPPATVSAETAGPGAPQP